MKRKFVALMLLLCCTSSVLLSGCQPGIVKEPISEQKNVSDEPATEKKVTEESGNSGTAATPVIAPLEIEEDSNAEAAYLTLSVNLARLNYQENRNMLVSPASVEFALGMALAGAEGKTLEEMNLLLGQGDSRNEILTFCKMFYDRLNDPENDSFHVANSFWINKTYIDSKLNPDYCATLKNNLQAEARLTKFDDSTVKEINNWVSKNTDEMIPAIINEIPDDAAAYLINALSFDGKWEKPYEEYQIKEDIFYNEDGSETTTDFLCETMGNYYEIENACGFRKNYKGGKYAFLAILPNEDVGLKNFLEGFTEETYNDFMDSQTYQYDVSTRLPKFTSAYDVTLNEQLQSLGMKSAFVPLLADFSGICAEQENGDNMNLVINKVLHKTYINVDENGTKASAVTSIEVGNCTTAVEPEKEWREVILDRPFLYAIIDNETNLPIFIGTVNQL